jgi:hypothetical protein
LPDHTALGAQAAGMILDVADNNWVLPDDMEVELPLSTVATIDLVQARERFALRSATHLASARAGQGGSG